jgi:hypothetical protein
MEMEGTSHWRPPYPPSPHTLPHAPFDMYVLPGDDLRPKYAPNHINTIRLSSRVVLCDPTEYGKTKDGPQIVPPNPERGAKKMAI